MPNNFAPLKQFGFILYTREKVFSMLPAKNKLADKLGLIKKKKTFTKNVLVLQFCQGFIFFQKMAYLIEKRTP